MRILLYLSWFLFVANSVSVHVVFVSGKCQSDQQSLLLQMKNSLMFNSSLSKKLVQWSPRTDCCAWSGVFCDEVGHVTYIYLNGEGISGGIENATGLFGLQYLRWLDLADNGFGGTQIPTSLAFSNLTQLVSLYLAGNNFTGSISSFHFPKSLSHLDLSRNALTDTISSIGWEKLSNLDYMDLSYNALTGRIPPSLFALPSLEVLDLSSNQFDGQLPKFSNASSLVLEILDLSSNILEGKIPMSVFQLKNLQSLSLSFNNLNGTVQPDWLRNLGHLLELDLSYNRLSVNASSSPFFMAHSLNLASCNLSVFPDLKDKFVRYLDLSNNKISGEIPNWIWELGLTSLNLSFNLLVGMQEPYSVSNDLFELDLHFNRLQGKIPLIRNPVYVDYSSNLFSSIPSDIGNFMSQCSFFSISNNKLKGVIPTSLCKADNLEVLDLSRNNFSGSIPRCLIRRSNNLDVLNLGRNNLSGFIPNKFLANCALQTLNLNGNHLEGMLPKSLANCKRLEVVDIGHNQMIDQFPCWSKNVSTLRVLVLRSNKFYGKVGCLEINGSWPLLQIVDLSSNNFSGRLPKKSFTNWKSMRVDHEDKAHPKLDKLGFEVGGIYYQDTVTITLKGSEIELVKILNIFTSMDLSCNHFEGPIPKEIGQLKSLHCLNLSHNALTGQIPSSIGNMGELESFDLSFNNLSGRIPPELASLNFLSVLNLSYNHFVGKIPLSTQLQSFSPTSFIGNQGLCGPPLTDNCTNPIKLPVTISSEEIDWRFVLMVIGFVIGFGTVVTPLMFSKKVNSWYDDRINNFLK